jgi:hypothetical protein
MSSISTTDFLDAYTEAPAGHEPTPSEGAIDTPLCLTTDVDLGGVAILAAGILAADTARELAAAATAALTRHRVTRLVTNLAPVTVLDKDLESLAGTAPGCRPGGIGPRRLRAGQGTLA